MLDFYNKIVDSWLSYRSIPIVGVLVLYLGGKYIPSIYNSEYENATVYAGIMSIVLLFLLLGYIIACYFRNRLPKAHKESIAVLFAIDAENETVYKSVRRKLVDNFQDLINIPNATFFEVICVSRNRLKKYPESKHEKIIELLEKVNCTIYISVKYEVDDVTAAENFEMKINYGVLHPRLTNEAERMLSYDMNTLGKTVKRRRFQKQQLLDELNFTAQTLSYICRYVMGMSHLLADHPNKAYELLAELEAQLKEEPDRCMIPNFLLLIQNRLYATLILAAKKNMDSFGNGYDIKHLQCAKSQLNAADKIYPDTYSYNMGMAYIAVALEHDGNQARACIDKCKKMKEDETWRYSDAFLSAYFDLPPMVVCARYKQAILSCTYNYIDLIAYIEYILETEPDKIALHLAVGLLYECVGDPVQMRRHFHMFLTQYSGKDGRLEKLLQEKMRNLVCDMDCDQKCDDCIAEHRYERAV